MNGAIGCLSFCQGRVMARREISSFVHVSAWWSAGLGGSCCVLLTLVRDSTKWAAPFRIAVTSASSAGAGQCDGDAKGAHQSHCSMKGINGSQCDAFAHRSLPYPIDVNVACDVWAADVRAGSRHRVPSRTMTFSVTNRFRITATIATFGGLPRASRRW